MYIMPYTDTIVGPQSGLYCHTDTVVVATAPVVDSMFESGRSCFHVEKKIIGFGLG